MTCHKLYSGEPYHHQIAVTIEYHTIFNKQLWAIRFGIILYLNYTIQNLWIRQSMCECICVRVYACSKCKHLLLLQCLMIDLPIFRQSSLGQFKSNRWIDWNSTWPKFNIMQSLIIVWNCVNLTANIKMKWNKTTQRGEKKAHTDKMKCEMDAQTWTRARRPAIAKAPITPNNNNNNKNSHTNTHS